jgi:integrase
MSRLPRLRTRAAPPHREAKRPARGVTAQRSATAPFDRKAHRVDHFSSGEASLDRWLIAYAGQNQQRDAARTFVTAEPDGKVVGYYTLVAAQVEHEQATSGVRQGLSRHFPIPVALIARLAVTTQHQGAGPCHLRARRRPLRAGHQRGLAGQAAARTQRSQTPRLLLAPEVDRLAAAAARGAHRDPDRPAVSDRELALRAEEDQQDAAIYLTAAIAGLRRSELLALLWDDVDFRHSLIRVHEGYSAQEHGESKSRRSHTVPMADKLADALKALKRRGHHATARDHVFVGRSGRPLDGSAAATPQAAIFRIVEDRHRDRLGELSVASLRGS